MIVKDLKQCDEFISGDGAILREFLNPLKDRRLDLRYSLAHAVIKPGQTSVPHRLKTSEVYYILEGEGVMHIDDESSNVQNGQAVYIPPGTIQYIHNAGKTSLVFLCIVDPAWRSEDEEVL
jgi:mannose-6-phosphate isomerase-like protein (cupin superfamily)